MAQALHQIQNELSVCPAHLQCSQHVAVICADQHWNLADEKHTDYCSGIACCILQDQVSKFIFADFTDYFTDYSAAVAVKAALAVCSLLTPESF